jgi:hypothetical protein
MTSERTKMIRWLDGICQQAWEGAQEAQEAEQRNIRIGRYLAYQHVLNQILDGHLLSEWGDEP